MSSTAQPIASGRKIRQKRSQKTYDALIATSFKLLEQREFDEISVAELAQKAGYSVGAFYARFHSKDELFDALVAQHLEDRALTRERLFATLPDDRLIDGLIEETVDYYWARRRFWRAALFRSIRDSDFWEPIRTQRRNLATMLIARIHERTGRTLSEAEETNVRFAAQVALGTINNTIINRPGPIFMGQASFVENLSRTFRLVSGYDYLMGTNRVGKRAKRGKKRR
jgi:AcrR family transcriptional regulator